jgi:hypothetical protein
VETSSISLKNQTELTSTTSTPSSKNAYSRFFCNLPLLVANFFYILPVQRPKTTTGSTKNASVPTVSGDNPVNSWDPSWESGWGSCWFDCSSSGLSNPFNGVSYTKNCSFMSCAGNVGDEWVGGEVYAHFVESLATDNNFAYYMVQATLFQYYDYTPSQLDDLNSFSINLGSETASEIMQTNAPFLLTFTVNIDTYTVSHLIDQQIFEDLVGKAAGSVTPEFEGEGLVSSILATADNKLGSKVESDLIAVMANHFFPSLPFINIQNVSFNIKC